jgi:CDP-diacylglycerol pyrophosphatase
VLHRKLAVFAVFLLAGAGSAYGLSRDALWAVGRACVAGYQLTGLSFPCLAVNIAQGEAEGYVVVQLPFGDRDTVLMPTRRMSGIEDPFLASDKAPNYIAMAWAERGRLAQITRRALEHRDIGLAINSRQTRSQDQLHIHIACVAAPLKSFLTKITEGLPPRAWTKLPRRIWAQQYWAYPLSADDLLHGNPLRLVTELQPTISSRRDSITVAVVGLGPSTRPSFVILAAATEPERGRGQSSAEKLLDHACR